MELELDKEALDNAMREFEKNIDQQLQEQPGNFPESENIPQPPVIPEKLLYSILPRGLWVLIRNSQIGERRYGEMNLIMPEGQSKSQRGEVVAISRGNWFQRFFGYGASDLRIGDLVVYTAFPIELPDIEELTGEKNLHLVRSEEVFAVAKPKV